MSPEQYRLIHSEAMDIARNYDKPGTVFKLPQTRRSDRTDIIRLGALIDRLAELVPFPPIPQRATRYWKPEEYLTRVEREIRKPRLLYSGQRFNGTIVPETLTILSPEEALTDGMLDGQKQPIDPAKTFNFLVLIGLSSTAAENFGAMSVRTTLYVHNLTPETGYHSVRMKNKIEPLEGYMTIEELLLMSGFRWLRSMSEDVRRPPITVSKTQ